MSRRVFTVLVIGVALAILCVLGWRAFAPADAGAPPVRTAAEAGPRANAALGSGAPTATGDTAANAGRSDATAPAPPERRVRIVDERGAPVVDAEVAFDVGEELRAEWRLFGFDVEERLVGSPRFRSAADGAVVLPTDASHAFVIARAGERFGHAAIEFDNPLWTIPELPIAPDRTLRIAVVSPRGEPRPGVPVVVTYVDSDPLAAYATSTRYLPRTGADGTTVMWHAQALGFWDRARAAVELQPFVIGDTPRPVRVVLAEEPPERIALECPDHGSIRVRAWTGPGIPNRSKGTPWLVDGIEPPGEMLLPGASAAAWTFFPVVLGRSWTTGVHDHAASEPFAGPVAHGTEVAVDLQIALARLWRVTLLRPDGQPCAEQAIVLGTSAFDRTATTDASGSLCFVAKADTVTFRAAQLRAAATVPVPDISAEPGAAMPDLGVVRLRPQELLAAGRVVDAATRRPMRLWLRAHGNADAEGRRALLANASTAVDGTFELWGDGSGRCTITGDKTGYRAVEVDVQPGARDVVIALQAVRRLRATVLLDPGITLESLDIHVRSAKETHGWRQARLANGSIHGLFELPDGEDLVLEVQPYGAGSVLGAVPMHEWVAEDGAFAASLDLRGALANVLVAVHGGRDEDDDVDGWLYVRRQGSREPWVPIPMRGTFAFAVARGTVLDAVSAPDCGCCTRTTLREGENALEVPDPPHVMLELAGLPSGVERSDVIVHILRLSRAEPLLDALVADGVDTLDAGEVAPWPRTAADLENLSYEIGERFDDGVLRVVVARRGNYIAVPYLEAPDKNVPLLDAAIRIEVTSPGQVVEATIRLDPEKVRAARK